MASDTNGKTDIYADFPKLKEIEPEKFPQFLFIIPDGNRRYAKEKGHPVIWGHKKGLDKVVEILRAVRNLPLKMIGFWGFSSDNWQRNEIEIKGLVSVFEFFLDRNIDELHENNSRFVHIGRKDRLPTSLVNKIINAEEKTKNNTGQIVVVALDFGGEDQMIRMIEKAKNLNGIKITPEILHSLRDGEGLVPSADLIIRTSEIRTSDVGWLNGKNTVLYFLPNEYFPQMEIKDLVDGIDFYVNTEKRQGA